MTCGLRRVCCSALIVGACLFALPRAHADTYLVNDGSDISATCATPTSLCTLRAAIQKANGRTGPDRIEFTRSMTVLVGPSGLPAVSGPLTIATGLALSVTIASAGASSVPLLTVRNSTTLGSGLTFDGDEYGVSITGSGVVVTATGVTFKNHARRAVEVTGGATLNCSGCSFLNNGAATSAGELEGGAIRAQLGTSLRIEDSTFTDNGAQEAGGAIAAIGAEVSVSNSRFERNTVSVGTGPGGGAIASRAYLGTPATSARLTVADCLFFSNESASWGGALVADEMSVTGSTFQDNLATGVEAGGGALRCSSSATIERSVFIDNSAPLGTGGAALVNHDLHVSQTAFRSNAAKGGGAIVAGSLWLDKSELYGNRGGSGDGGAVFVGLSGASGETIDVRSSTFVDNSAGAGAALYVGQLGASSAQASVVHCTFQGNTSFAETSGAIDTIAAALGNNVFDSNLAAAQDRSCAARFAGSSMGANVTTDDSCGASSSDLPNTDALLEDFGFHGASTRTLRVAASSPAIDIAVATPSGPTGDQRGLPFVSLSGSSAGDAGAYEHGAGGWIGFASASLGIVEGDTVSVAFVSGGPIGAATFDVALTAGSADVGADVVTNGSTVGLSALAVLSLSALDDAIEEGDEMLNAVLSASADSAVDLGANSSVTVTISDRPADAGPGNGLTMPTGPGPAQDQDQRTPAAATGETTALLSPTDDDVTAEILARRAARRGCAQTEGSLVGWLMVGCLLQRRRRHAA